MSISKQYNTNKYIYIFLFFALYPCFSKAQISEKWWLKSALEDTVQNVQFYTSLNYNFSNTNSVIKNTTHFGVLNIVLRKNRITNIAAYSLNKMHIKLDVPIVLDYSTTAHYFTDFFDYDFTKVIYGQSGFIWERDNVLLLQNRYTFYAGLGVKQRLLKKLKTKTLFAVGRLNQDYTIPVDQIDVIKEPYYAGYIRFNYEYPINQKLSFSGQAVYFTNLTEKERFRYGINFDVQIELIKHVSLYLGYSYKYDKENERLGILPITSVQNIGIKFSI